MRRIITLTMNPTVDMSADIDHVVAGRKLRCASPRREPGGGGINVSRALRNLGGESAAVYPAGGEMGDLLRRLLDGEGIDHIPVTIAGETRENVNIMETATGRQFRFGMPGPELREKEWRGCIDAVVRMEPAEAYVVASGSLPPGVPDDFYAALARAVKEAGGWFVLDAPGEALAAAVEEGVYLVKPNMREFRRLACREIDCDEEQEAAAREIVERGGAEVLVVSQGAAGVLVATGHGCVRFRSPVVPVRSRVGAGDSMVAGMVSSLALGNALEEAVRFGVAAGAAAVMTPGTELCRGEDAVRLYERMIVHAAHGAAPAAE